MKNQKIRRAILLLSFILLPATFNFFSPYLIVTGLLEKVIGGAFVIWMLFLLSSLILGRTVCSYVCPYGGLQLLIDKFHCKNLKQIAWLRWFKHGLGVVWLAVIIAAFVLGGGQKKFDMLYLTENFVSADNWAKLVFYYVLIAILSIAPLLLGKRAVCRYLCPMSIITIIGSKLSNAAGIPSLHLAVQNEKCVKCGKCSKACPMSLNVMGMVQKGNMRNTECILCGECCSACSSGVLRRKFGSPKLSSRLKKSTELKI